MPATSTTFEFPAEPPIGSTVLALSHEYVRTQQGWLNTAPARERIYFSWPTLMREGAGLTLTTPGNEPTTVTLPVEPPVGTTLKKVGSTRTWQRHHNPGGSGWAQDPDYIHSSWAVLLREEGPLEVAVRPTTPGTAEEG